jgi:hypothetical protein
MKKNDGAVLVASKGTGLKAITRKQNPLMYCVHNKLRWMQPRAPIYVASLTYQ